MWVSETPRPRRSSRPSRPRTLPSPASAAASRGRVRLLAVVGPLAPHLPSRQQQQQRRSAVANSRSRAGTRSGRRQRQQLQRSVGRLAAGEAGKIREALLAEVSGERSGDRGWQWRLELPRA
ncbi:uncharacterized protein [Triticum aestivum]|uniref:uncharacterized protein n=1 Tax=Triticum aestivum TaxID=4565 RepID=UPI001D01D4AD|nr:uncharacterized protein LOC123135951 [Triticum aestivum]